MANLITQLVRWLRIIGMASMIAMMLVTIVDVTMRNTINELVLGGVEIVQLTLVFAVFLALPETFLRGEHIEIDVIDAAVGPRGVKILQLIGSLLTLALLAAMAWRMVPAAFDTLEIGDHTSDLQLHLFWYWVPLLLGGAASVLAMALVVVREIASFKANAA